MIHLDRAIIGHQATVGFSLFTTQLGTHGSAEMETDM